MPDFLFQLIVTQEKKKINGFSVNFKETSAHSLKPDDYRDSFCLSAVKAFFSRRET